ncbi:hypothetical protein IWX84_000811 [Flavobacterium sp. CG_9.10]|nr:hypothetical protein [Flavobacterium sp. CG_9.10]
MTLVKLLFLFGAISSCSLYLFISLKKRDKKDAISIWARVVYFKCPFGFSMTK